ncbi:MAG TPA: PilT/PilU family type 4a pilus ATPase [Methylotenera sp.]|jgi:twitching motility protein PilU|nr:MAG: type IV pili twitching motility protein PilT [Mehylophilales bacterium 35-46-6]OZA45446.1 MAG: type IV pili twitching motility protein PilT [Polaromonas sp. 17-63-33]OZA47861.1 MAG: type IV pili twitching motility protein PilT [Methylophilales bacterium 39-45-7]HQS38174.1 PilT/PilU family type 4a pilus ATPase [Methylotenera sp.]HQS44681.1 PilT/PilU family type 4a pilus ATPase [Methylotenera sp.]
MTNEQALSYMHSLLRGMLEKKASDLFISADFPPAMKIDGKMTPVTQQKLSGEHSKLFADVLMNDRQRKEFAEEKECNFAIWPKEIGRFRVNVFVQQEKVGMVLRTITTTIPRFDDLGLPPVLKDVMMVKRGLVILVGGTGSGKSTTLAALINHRNENSYGHIITVEDPVEYVHPSKNCLVTHREVGRDTNGWFNALKNTLRQAPDVILIGEIRDKETMEFALAFAETGHLCMATLHANSSNQALDRIINFFPEERHAQLHMDLSLNLQAFVSQRLVSKAGGGRVAAIEILLNSPLISDLILKGETNMIKEIMAKSTELGMQTFDQALFDLAEAGRISQEDALRNADSINELRLRFKLKSKNQEQSGLADQLSLHEEPKPEEEEDADNPQAVQLPAAATKT